MARMTDLRSPLQGQLVSWLVAPGETVRQGQVLGVVEAMKMEHELRAPADGRVFFFANEEMPASLVVKKGQRVALNEWDGADPPLSEVSIDGEVAYTNASRASMNRFYFAEEGL